MDTSKFINLALLGHPMNWLIVWTVLLFGGFAWHLVLSRVAAPPSDPTGAVA